MGMVTKISFRNLIRQKRRNLFLGSGIALCMCLLVMAMSLINGFSDILFNKVIVYMTGHMHVTTKERDDKKINIVRDRDKLTNLIMDNLEGVDDVWEEVGTFVRCIANGKAASIALLGMWDDNEFSDYFEILEGSFDDIFREDIYNPILIYDMKAKEMNIGLNDIIKIKLTTIHGQIESATFTVAAIAKAGHMFEATGAFTDIKKLKTLMGYKQHETGGLNIILKKIDNPLSVKNKANLLHKALQPEAAGIIADVFTNDTRAEAKVFAYKTSLGDIEAFNTNLLITARYFINSDEEKLKAAYISNALADEMGLRPGDAFSFEYKTRYDERSVSGDLIIAGLFDASGIITGEMIFAHEDVFHGLYFPNLPEKSAVFDKENPLFSALLTEWFLLDRSWDADSSRIKHQELKRSKWKGTALDVQTMYEFDMAAGVLALEEALKSVSIVAIVILFFVILVGVINTLRMSIKERTREIGTNRAIGMQRGDVRTVFITEVFFLTVFACIIGVMLAFIIMGLLTFYKIDLKDNPFNMLLVDKHLYFLPTIGSILNSFISILVISVIIAFFPARRAAKMSIADALRHYE